MMMAICLMLDEGIIILKIQESSVISMDGKD
jgi:hypothetical protein